MRARIACVLLAGPAVLARGRRWPTSPASRARTRRWPRSTAALERKDGDALADLLGPEHRADLVGGDPAQARQWMDELNALVRQGARLEPERGRQR